MKKIVRTDKAPAPGGAYSQAIRIGNLLYTAGMGPMDPKTQDIVGTTVEEQTRQTLANLKAVIEEAGLTMANVVKSTVYLEELDRDFAGFNQVYSEFFPDDKPVRTTVGAHLKNILVEIDLVAVTE